MKAVNKKEGVGTYCFILKSGLRITIGMDKAIATTPKDMYSPMRAVHAIDAVPLLLSSFQVSKLRSLTLEDNFNNTFCSKCLSKQMLLGIATNLAKRCDIVQDFIL